MKELLVNIATSHHIDNFISKPGHALMLVGAQGMGKQAIAEYIASNILKVPVESLSQHPYIHKIVPIDGKAIGIDSVRALDHFLSLKVPNDSYVNRIVFIENGHLLSIEAQNALLKMLEEPPKGTLFILTASHAQSLLPTIRSRVQSIEIIKPSHEDLVQYFQDKGFQKKDIETAIKMSGGLPGLMSAILNQEDHPLNKATATARSLLSKNHFERLIMVDELSKNKQLAIDTLHILKQMAHLSLVNGSDVNKWHKVLKASYEADKLLAQNGNPKLVLDKLMLAL